MTRKLKLSKLVNCLLDNCPDKDLLDLVEMEVQQLLKTPIRVSQKPKLWAPNPYTPTVAQLRALERERDHMAAVHGTNPDFIQPATPLSRVPLYGQDEQ